MANRALTFAGAVLVFVGFLMIGNILVLLSTQCPPGTPPDICLGWSSSTYGGPGGTPSLTSSSSHSTSQSSSQSTSQSSSNTNSNTNSNTSTSTNKNITVANANQVLGVAVVFMGMWLMYLGGRSRR